MEQIFGSPTYYKLLEEMKELHSRKSHDYASNENPVGNYHFAGTLALLFVGSPEDAGFVGRLGEKIYRLANLQKDGKEPLNESIEDTERDIAVICSLWMASRMDKRRKPTIAELEEILRPKWACATCFNSIDVKPLEMVIKNKDRITHTAYFCSEQCKEIYTKP